MWWCCGKLDKSAPGCKFAKHITREDDDEDMMVAQGTATPEEIAEMRRLKKLSMRCQCCKEKGHEADECHRDPNIRTQGLHSNNGTTTDINKEEDRIA